MLIVVNAINLDVEANHEVMQVIGNELFWLDHAVELGGHISI